LSFLLYGQLARFLGAFAIGLAPLILGCVGLHEYLSRLPGAAYGRSWSDILFYDLQLPVLSAAPVQGPGPYPVPLGIARLLAPAVAGLAAVGTLRLLLTEQWRRWSAAAAGRHSIVAGDGVVAVEVGRRLSAEGRKVVLVSASDDTLAQARRSNLLDVRGDPADRDTLRAAGIGRAAELYACTTEGAVNAAITLRARDEIRAAKRRPLSAYALVRDVELGVALRARRIGAAGDPRLRLDFFDVEAIAARKLLDVHPLPAGEQGEASVVIAGFGPLGQAILSEIARRYRPLPGRPPIEVVIRHATEAEVKAVANTFSAIGDSCSLRYGAAATLPTTGDCTVFVCLDAADDALREGLAMTHALAGKRGRVVVCLRESSPFAGVLAARSGLIDDVMGKLSVFGVIQEGCVPADIRADFTEQLARAIHGAYVAMEVAKGNTEAANPSVVPWERLPEQLRQSNIAQADDIGIKLDAIGATVIPQSAAAPEFAFTRQEIELLARMEHDRWMRERTRNGWKHGEQRDDTRKLHPDLIDWAYLSDEARDKDRNAISSLPATLHEAGFQILRLPEDGPN
jgi:voltage-gated potassium channel Kch